MLIPGIVVLVITSFVFLVAIADLYKTMAYLLHMCKATDLSDEQISAFMVSVEIDFFTCIFCVVLAVIIVVTAFV